MRITLVIFFLFFVLFNSCKDSKLDKIESFEFAVYENKPVFVDEYLYKKENKKGITYSQNKTEWYLVDWDNNGVYNELGIDYYGVKSPFKRRPILSILKGRNTLNHNNVTYYIDSKTGFRELIKTDFEQQNNISYISDFIPIELVDDNTINSDVFEGYNKTVIYFWATWCAPCVKNLENIERNRTQLDSQKINFIPIYYGCTYGDVVTLNKKRGLNFTPLEVSINSAISYQLAGLPEVYVFDSNGKLIAEEFDIE